VNDSSPTCRAERNEPIDLPLSNEALAGIAEMAEARREFRRGVP
jgi:hypothetical protein